MGISYDVQHTSYDIISVPYDVRHHVLHYMMSNTVERKAASYDIIFWYDIIFPSLQMWHYTAAVGGTPNAAPLTCSSRWHMVPALPQPNPAYAYPPPPPRHTSIQSLMIALTNARPQPSECKPASSIAAVLIDGYSPPPRWHQPPPVEPSQSTFRAGGSLSQWVKEVHLTCMGVQ
jgi:hypothetical protein